MYNSLASNLPPASDLTAITPVEESIIYDRTGKTELARFGDERREVVTYEEIPPILLDATTAIEDKTFWDNAGFDPLAIISAGLDSIRGNSRGASTITQQLVRARLLPDDLVQDPNRTVERKLKEIIQSIRVTQAFGGEEGKQKIITAYLNQNYYGNQSYGVKAAVESYFGKPLADITPAEAAIIASLPKSPSNYDLVHNAVEECTTAVAEDADCPKARLIVPDTTTIVARRNSVLDLLAEGRTPKSGTQYTAQDFRNAKGDEVLLASQVTPHWLAPHFVWAVRDELTALLCDPDATTCEALQRGGLRVTTTLDLRLQAIAEKWVQASALVPHKPKGSRAAAARALGFDTYPDWIRNLEGKHLRNGSLVALDYQTGELVAYVGSADYYSTKSRKAFQPQYDVVGHGFRQPGSAFKPFNYAIGIDDGALTAGSMLMDSATDFGGGYTPSDADNLERGPVRIRNALQFSLNIPSVKAMAINKPQHVFDRAKDFGITFQQDKTDAGLALAPGRRGDPPGRPRDGLRHARQRRDEHRAHDDPDHPGSKRQGRRQAVHAACRHPGHQAPVGIHRHRHPGRQHESEGQSVSGASSPSTARTPAGRRHSRPVRTMTPRTSTPTGISRRPPRRAAPQAPMRSLLACGTATATTRRSRRPESRSSRSTSRPTSGRASSRRPAASGR